MSNKIHLITRRDKKTNYFYFGKKNYRLNLCGSNARGMDGYWIDQLSKELGKDNFMKDFRDILILAEKRGIALFTLYELPEVVLFDVED